MTREDRIYSAFKRILKSRTTKDVAKGAAVGGALGAGVGVIAKGISNKRKGEKFFRGTGKAALVGGGTGAVIGGVANAKIQGNKRKEEYRKVVAGRFASRDERAEDFRNRERLKNKLDHKALQQNDVKLDKKSIERSGKEGPTLIKSVHGSGNRDVYKSMRQNPHTSGDLRRKYVEAKVDERWKKQPESHRGYDARMRKKSKVTETDKNDADEAIRNHKSKK